MGVIRGLSDRADRVVRWVLLLLISIESVIVVVSVFSRYVLNYSFPWSEEMARAILTWLVFLGASSALKNNEMAAMESIREKLPAGGARVVRVLNELIVIGLLACVVYATDELIARTFRQSFPVTRIPMWTVYLAIPIGSLLMILHTIVRLARAASGSPIGAPQSFDDAG